MSSPPEVRGERPVWSPAVDIYRFGATIRDLAASKVEDPQAKDLFYLIDHCLCHEPSERLSADDLVMELERLRASLRVDEIRNRVWRQLHEEAGELTDRNMFSALLTKFRRQFEAIALGLTPSVLELCSELSVFLDQTLEAFSTQGEGLKLGKVKHDGRIREVPIERRSIEFAHRLRLEKSHFNGINVRQKIERDFPSLTDVQMKQFLDRAASQIEHGLELPNFSKVVKYLLTLP